jgi:hypothetical protein
LGAGLTIQPRKKVIVTKHQRGGQGPIWAVEPYDDDDLLCKNVKIEVYEAVLVFSRQEDGDSCTAKNSVIYALYQILIGKSNDAWEVRNVQKFWLESLKRRFLSECLDVDESMILNLIMRKRFAKVWTGFIWFMIGIRDGLL